MICILYHLGMYTYIHIFETPKSQILPKGTVNRIGESPKLFQLFQGLLEKYDPRQYLIENFIKLTSCSSNLVEYLFFHIRLWKMYHVPLKDLWMSLRTSSKIQIIINNLMLFKHQNGLLLITQEKKKEKITPYCHYPFTSSCHVKSCFICF